MTAKAKEKAKKPSTGSVQPLDPVFTAWMERQFRGESPTSIDCYPLWKGRDQQMRLYHYDIKANEQVGTERAVELANEIFSDCQINCDSLPANALYKGTKTYEVLVIDDRRGGKAHPVGSHILTMTPRIHRPAPKDGESVADDLEGNEATAAQRVLIESVQLIHDRDRAERENEGKIVGDTMLVMKSALESTFDKNNQLIEKNIAMVDKFLQMATQISEQRDSARAVEIDALNAAENRRDQASRREREGMWTDVMKAGMLEAVQVVGKFLPGIGGLFMAQMTGKPIPDPPQLAAAPAAPPNGQPQLAAAPEEKVVIDRFIAAAEAHRIDADHTAAEKLFGKDDDKTHAILEAGVFTRAQVAILTGVHTGTLPIEALDALLPDSGKAEAVTMVQILGAIAYLTPPMKADLDRFMTLRKEKRAKPA